MKGDSWGIVVVFFLAILIPVLLATCDLSGCNSNVGVQGAEDPYTMYLPVAEGIYDTVKYLPTNWRSGYYNVLYFQDGSSFVFNNGEDYISIPFPKGTHIRILAKWRVGNPDEYKIEKVADSK